MLILGQLARSTNEGEKRRGKKEVEHLSSLRRRGRRSGWARGTRARWRRDAVSSRYRQLILRFEEPRPQIGRGLNWSRGSRNRIARATPATYSARPRFKEPDQPISTSFLARCRALPTWGNRSAPIRCICSVKSTRPRPCSRVPRCGKQDFLDSCFFDRFFGPILAFLRYAKASIVLPTKD